MQLCEISFQPGIDSKTRGELQKLAEEATTIEEILAGWPLIKTERISFEQAIDDENPDLPLIVVQLKRGKEEIARMYFTKDASSKIYPEITPIEHYKVGFTDRGGIVWNEARWEEMYAELGFEESEVLYSQIGPNTALLPFILRFINSDGGGVDISRSDYFEEEIGELKEQGVDPSNLLTIHTSYFNPTPIKGVLPGFGDTVHIRLDEGVDVAGTTQTLVAERETMQSR